MVGCGSFLDVEHSAPIEHSQGIVDESKKEAIGLTRSRDMNLGRKRPQSHERGGLTLPQKLLNAIADVVADLGKRSQDCFFIAFGIGRIG